MQRTAVLYVCKLIPWLSAVLSFQHHFPHCWCFCQSPSHRFLFPVWQQWLQFVSQLLLRPLLSPLSIACQTGDICRRSRGHPMMSVHVYNKITLFAPPLKFQLPCPLLSLTLVVLTFFCACHPPNNSCYSIHRHTKVWQPSGLQIADFFCLKCPSLLALPGWEINEGFYLTMNNRRF